MPMINLKKLLEYKNSLQVDIKKSKWWVACSVICFIQSVVFLVHTESIISLCLSSLVSLACAFIMFKEIDRIRVYQEYIQDTDEQVKNEIKNIVRDDMNCQEKLDN